MALTLLRIVLGVILLSDVSFEPTYHEVHKIPVLQAGISPMNTTFPDQPGFNLSAVDYFWWYFPSILADGKVSTPAAPLSCTDCVSFLLPGALASVQFDPTQPNITSEDYTTATAFRQDDAPGYQIDYSPITSADPSMTLDDCRVYGVSFVAVQLCLKASNSSLLAGNAP